MFTYMLSSDLNHLCSALACSVFEIANSCVNTLQTFSAVYLISYVFSPIRTFSVYMALCLSSDFTVGGKCKD